VDSWRQPIPLDEGGGPSTFVVARLEAGAHEAGGVQVRSEANRITRGSHRPVRDNAHSPENSDPKMNPKVGRAVRSSQKIPKTFRNVSDGHRSAGWVRPAKSQVAW
jgi:hypothetical protein